MELQKKITAYISDSITCERERMVLWTPVLLAIGIGIYFSLIMEPPVWLGPVLLMLTALSMWFVRRRPIYKALTIALAITALGFTIISLRTHILAAPSIYSTLYFRTIEGTIDNISQKEKGQKLILSHVSIERIWEKTTPPRISVTLKNKTSALHVGDRVQLKAILFPPPSPTMPGAYDFSRHYYYDQIGAVGFAPREPVILSKATTLSWHQWLTELRLSINDRIMHHMSERNGPVAAALMVGEQSAISKGVRADMRDSGLYHVLSISGLHMSLAVALLYISLRFVFNLYPPIALRYPTKKIAAITGLAGAFIYLLLAGYPVPAVRSFVMVACVMLAILCDRRGISMYSLAWAATLILLIQPEALIGASFQLSFAATLAIIAFYERYAHLLHMEGRGVWYKLRLYFLGLMATSLVATLATTPLVIYHFNRFTILGLVANMLMMPLASFMIMPAAVLSFIMMPFGLEAYPLSWLEVGISWMLDFAHWLASMPQGAFAVPPLTFTGLLISVFGGLWLCLMAGRWRYYGAAFVIIGMTTIGLHTPYDVLISNDGKKIALRLDNDQFVLLKGRPTSYDAQSWLRYHGQDDALIAADLEPSAGRVCEGKWCVMPYHSQRIAIGTGKEAWQSFCDIEADIIIADSYLDKRECQPEALVIDRKFIYRNGSVAMRVTEENIMMDVADDIRRHRPWSSDAQYQRYHPRN